MKKVAKFLILLKKTMSSMAFWKNENNEDWVNENNEKWSMR